MRVTTNERLATRRRRQAMIASLAGISVLAVGLVINLQATRAGADSHQQLLIAYVALVGGSILSWIGVVLSDRWAARPRADVALETGLKGAGPAYKLYNWALPAEHVLLAPWGLAVFTVFNVEGPVAIRGAKWRDARPLYRKLLSLGRRSVRNPAPVLSMETGALARELVDRDPELADVEIESVAVFSHPSCVVSVQDSTIPVTTLTTMRDWLRSEGKRPTLSSVERRRLEKALDAVAEERLAQ